MTNILAAIGSSVSDDPTMAGNTGIAKPIDILCLQESNGFSSTGQSYAAILNSLYPTENYQVVHLDGASTDPHKSTQSMVYNANAVSVVSSGVVGTANSGGQPRQTLRYEVRPVGYSDSSDVYIYNSHYKSSDGSANKTRRNVEAQADPR